MLYGLGAFCFLLGIFVFGLPMLLIGATEAALLPLAFGGVGGLIWLCGFLFSREG